MVVGDNGRNVYAGVWGHRGKSGGVGAWYSLKLEEQHLAFHMGSLQTNSMNNEFSDFK